MEHNRLAGKLGRIVLGEGNVNVLLLAHLHADELLLKAGNEAAGADLQVKILALAAVEGHAVVKALKVDVGGVALLYGALHAHQTAVALGHFLQAGVHVGSHDLHSGLGSLQALILAQLYLGIHGNGGLEGHAVLAAVLQLYLGITHYIQLFLADGLLIGVGQHNIHGLLIEDLHTVHALNDLARSLAGAETGDVHLAAHLQISLVDGSLKVLGADFNGQCDLALFQFFTGFYTHFVFPPFSINNVNQCNFI